jgi:hypothetical protein
MKTLRAAIGLIKSRSIHMFVKENTIVARFWLATLSFFFAVDMLIDIGEPSDILMQLMAPAWCWATLFFVNSAALLYGVITKRYDTFLLILEGILGTALWFCAAFAHWYSQGAPDAITAGALMATWLLIRYPTHWEYTNGSS